jgi:hypothetical protein
MAPGIPERCSDFDSPSAHGVDRNRREFPPVRRIDGAHLREEPPFGPRDVRRGQALTKHGRLRTRLATGDLDRKRNGRRSGRSGIRAAGHRNTMRAHILKKQAAKFFGAIAGELAGRYEFAGERRSKDRRVRDLDRYLFLSMGVTAHDEKT